MKENLTQVASYDQYSDSEYEYDFYIEGIIMALKDIGSVWDVTVHNGNWRGQTGTLTSSDPERVAEALLMHDGQCRTEVGIGEEDDTLEGVCYHHDTPTGSTFYIKGNK